MRVRIAWLLLGLTIACAIVDTIFTAAYTPLLSEAAWANHGWPLATLATIGCSAMGALVVSRHERHPLGWLLLVAGLSSISLATEAYSIWALGTGSGPALAGHLAAYVSSLFNAPLAITALVLLFLLAPDGHLASPRWRWVARAAVIGLASYTVGTATVDPTTFTYRDTNPGPISVVFLACGLLLVTATLLTSAVGVTLRLRRSRGEARRQLLWIASAAALIAAGFVFLLVAQAIFTDGRQTWVSATPLYLAYLAMPICTAVAVLRHRLVDIDLIVNRAIVVTLATGLVAVAYVLVVVTVGPVVGGGSGFWPSLLATAVVALAFQPLRRWVLRVADRLAYGPAAAPYEALADLSRRLGDSPDPTRLLPAVAEAAGTAVGARRATARLHVPSADDTTACWPAGKAEGRELEFPVQDGDERLGVVSVEMPPGRPLRPRDAALLRDLADQAVVAFRNARLSAELAHRVTLLAARTADLEESRRRLVSAGDAERRRLERSIARDVVPHLEPLPQRLAAIADGGPSPADLAGPLAQVGGALENLREITRGVYPAQLARSGLEPALRSLLVRARAGRLDVEDLPGRADLDPRVEAAVYFCAAEAVRELDERAAVSVSRAPEGLRLVVAGAGSIDALPVANMRDRAEAAGGALRAAASEGAVRLEVLLPLLPSQRAAADQAATSRSGVSSTLGR